MKKKKESSKPLYIFCGDETKEEILKIVNELANSGDGLIILEMPRVNMDIVESVHDMIKNRLRVKPIYAQERKRVGIGDFPYYTYQKIVEAEKTINMYANTLLDHPDKDGDIKSLSPLEKFIAAYIIATKFAEYKEEDNAETSFKNYHVSRSVYEIALNTINRRIVCVGYVNFPRELLYRVGIKETAAVEFSFVKEPLNNFGGFDGHERMLVHIKDPKYNIDGVYMSDPTLDSGTKMRSDISHMLMTYEEAAIDDSRFEMDLDEGVLGSNEYSRWYLINELGNYEFKEELFHNPIPKDTIVKAFLAVEHFLDKEMKMVNNSEYGLLEYYDMAFRLKIIELFNDEVNEKIYNEAIKYKYSDFYLNYPKLADWVFPAIFNRKLHQKYNDFYLKSGGVIKYSPMRRVDNLSELSFLTKTKDNIIYKLDDRSIEEQLNDIYKACDEIINERSKMSGKK